LNELLRNETPVNAVAKNNQAVNVSETTEAFKIEVAAPGFDKTNFNVTSEKDVLTIAATKEANNTENGTLRRKEFNYNEFKRTFRLPENVNTEAIEAAYVNGILTVTLPKVVAPAAKKVEIG
jgi:HSP20 family protein